ncbi:MAG: glycosyltransferase family 1 protein [Fimbriimonadaceae bacterium]
MPKKTIAIDARLIGQKNTGDTSYWTGLVRALAKTDSDFLYLLFSNTPQPAEVPDSDKFQWIEMHSSRDRWWSLLRFPLAARRLRASAIHVQYNLSPLVGHGGITTVHDVSFYADPTWFRPQDRLILQRMVPSSCRRAEKVITVSEFSKAEILKNISGLGDKVAVTHNACGDDVQRMGTDYAQSMIEQELGFQGPFLLAVGTRWPRKNLQLAMNAVKLLPDSFPHKLLLTGKEGWGEEELNDRVVPVGYVSRELLNALYSSADAYLAPAHYEGFGITLLEAFRCGCPVLASSNGAHREAGGAAPIYGADWTPETWAKQLADLLSSDSSKLQEVRQRGFEQEGKFSWARCATQTEQIYKEVIANN